MKAKKPELLPDLTSEVASGFFSSAGFIIGVDEVGRGCLAGPVVAGAVALSFESLNGLGFLPRGERPESFPHSHFIHEVRDSKLIAEPLRAPLAKQVESFVQAFSVQEASVEEISRLNILYASHLAMERAVLAIEKQCGRKADLVLVDGNIVPKALRDRGHAIVKGDLKSLTIACASILAKVYRDTLMEQLDEKYPGYGHKKHKGYPTPFHKERILALGVTEIHRKGFKGVVSSLKA